MHLPAEVYSMVLESAPNSTSLPYSSFRSGRDGVIVLYYLSVSILDRYSFGLKTGIDDALKSFIFLVTMKSH